MKSRNEYSVVSERAIKRVLEIVDDALGLELPSFVKSRWLDELKFQKATLEKAFAFRKSHGPRMSIADSDAYFSEKLGNMISFAEMAVDPELHGGGYSQQKISESVHHYSFLVSKLVVAKFQSRSSRPASDRAIKEASYDNRDALERLVNR